MIAPDRTRLIGRLLSFRRLLATTARARARGRDRPTSATEKSAAEMPRIFVPEVSARGSTDRGRGSRVLRRAAATPPLPAGQASGAGMSAETAPPSTAPGRLTGRDDPGRRPTWSSRAETSEKYFSQHAARKVFSEVRRPAPQGAGAAPATQARFRRRCAKFGASACDGTPPFPGGISGLFQL